MVFELLNLEHLPHLTSITEKTKKKINDPFSTLAAAAATHRNTGHPV